MSKELTKDGVPITAHQFLVGKGVKSIKDMFSAYQVEEMLTEYAKQEKKKEAIGFVGWIVEEGYEVHAINAWMKINDTGMSPILNREQLYELFLIHKESKP